MAETLKKGRKKWIRILGPGYFKNNLLGESYVFEAENLLGKKLLLNLSHLSGDMRKQHINIGFKINEVKGSEVHADVVSYSMVPAHVKRMVRANKDKLDDSFVVETKDKFRLRVKPVVLTKNKTKNSILAKIRGTLKEYFTTLAQHNDFKDVLDGLIMNSIQKELKDSLNKIYPLIIIEIRRLDIIK